MQQGIYDAALQVVAIRCPFGNAFYVWLNRSGKYGRKMKIMKNSMSLGITVIALIVLPHTVQADWLDLVAEKIEVTNLRTGVTGTSVAAEPGDTLNVVCHEWIGLFGDHEVWQAGTIESWENRVNLDGKDIAIFRPTLAKGTIIGSQTSSSGVLGLGGTKTKKGAGDIRNVYPTVTWVAAGIADHEISCILNQPKTISDHKSDNNVARAFVFVRPAVEVASGTPEFYAGPTQVSAAPGSSGTGASNPGMATVQNPRNAASGMRAVNPQAESAPQAAESCGIELSYYVPKAPVVTASDALETGVPVQIRCVFDKMAKTLEWPHCDNAARNIIEGIMTSQDSGSRYSGIVVIDDANTGVTSSPVDGTAFEHVRNWTFSAPGTHSISCEVDNGLRLAEPDAPARLMATVSLEVAVSSGKVSTGLFDIATARRVATRPAEPQTTLVDSAAPGGVTQQRNILVNPATNPQGEVPSSKQSTVSDLINPGLNPQPEVPSSKQVGGDELVNPSLNPQPEVPSRKRQTESSPLAPAEENLPPPPTPMNETGTESILNRNQAAQQ